MNATTVDRPSEPVDTRPLAMTAAKKRLAANRATKRAARFLAEAEALEAEIARIRAAS